MPRKNVRKPTKAWRLAWSGRKAAWAQQPSRSTWAQPIRSPAKIPSWAIFDLGNTLTTNINRLQREMDQIVLVVEPNPVALAMARELLQDLEPGSGVSGRVHVVVVNRAQSNVQTPWHEVEHMLGQELRAI